MVTQVELPGVVEPEGLRLRSRPTPQLRQGQALVRMEATGISFAEQQMRRGTYYDQPPFPFVPGYDVVGIVESVSDEAGDQPANPSAEVGRRVAALTKTGGWADRIVLARADLVPVPDGLNAEEAEAVIVNGITARRLLARASVTRGDTVVVLGANGGVASLLVQMARCLGATVVGVASLRHLPYVRELGALPVDRHGDVAAQIQQIAPDGVAAVFDHVGGTAIRQSWAMLGRGGVLVSYGTAATRDRGGNSRLPVLALTSRLLWWNVLPNGRSAAFFDLWAGRRRHPQRYRAELRTDLEAVFQQLRTGQITARIARAFPLSQIAEAMRFAESGAAAGKVVLVPDPE